MSGCLGPVLSVSFPFAWVSPSSSQLVPVAPSWSPFPLPCSQCPPPSPFPWLGALQALPLASQYLPVPSEPHQPLSDGFLSLPSASQSRSRGSRSHLGALRCPKVPSQQLSLLPGPSPLSPLPLCASHSLPGGSHLSSIPPLTPPPPPPRSVLAVDPHDGLGGSRAAAPQL